MSNESLLFGGFALLAVFHEPVIRALAWAVLVAAGNDPGPWTAWGSL